MRLRPDDVDTEGRLVRIVEGKGRKDRNVPLTTAAAQATSRYLTQGRPALVRREPWLFLGRRGGRLHRAQVGDIVKAWAKTARVKKTVSCHTFRHGTATHLLRGGADIRQIPSRAAPMSGRFNGFWAMTTSPRPPSTQRSIPGAWPRSSAGATPGRGE